MNVGVYLSFGFLGFCFFFTKIIFLFFFLDKNFFKQSRILNLNALELKNL